MKKNFKAKAVPVALLTALMLGNTISAFAATGQTTLPFPKTILMDASETVPDVTFPMTITAGTVTNGEYVRTGVESKTNAGQKISRLSVYAGITPDKVKITSGNKTGTAGAVFTSTTTTTKGDIGTDGKATASSNKKFATDNMTIDFSAVDFTAPGVYRYILTEGTVSGYTSDITNTQGTAKKRIIEVYVKNNASNTGVEIDGYVVYKVTDGATLSNGATSIVAGPNKNGSLDASDVKDTGKVDVSTNDGGVTDPTGGKTNNVGGFVNKMDSTYFTSTAIEVSGNQSSDNKYFKVTYTITGLTSGQTLHVDTTGIDQTPTKTPTTIYSPSIMGAANTTTTLAADSTGKITHDFYVKAGDTVKIGGFKEADHRKIEVTVENEDYAPTIKGQTGTDLANTATFDQTGAGNAEVTFKLDKTGVVPTGVVLDSAPYIGGLAMAALGGAYLVLKKKDDEE